MFKNSILLGLVISSLWSLPSLRAELIVSLPDPASSSFLPGSGIRTIDLRVQSTTADQLFSFTADVRLGNGVFGNPAGEYGRPGGVGSSNIATSSFFIRDANDTKIASLSIDFSAAQLIPVTTTPIALLNIDITNLAPGTYPISFIDVSAVSTAGPLTPTFSSSSFTISAIPEPTSIGLALAGCAVTTMCTRRRRPTLA